MDGWRDGGMEGWMDAQVGERTEKLSLVGKWV